MPAHERYCLDLMRQARRSSEPRAIAELGIRYLPYSQLQHHREAVARFESGLKPMLELSQLLQ